MSSRVSGRPATGVEPVTRAVDHPNKPTACRRCGSVYFMDLTARMYASGGLELRAIGTASMRVFICPCGEILAPPGLNSGNQAGGERDLFAQSLAAALACRAEEWRRRRDRPAHAVDAFGSGSELETIST